MRDEVAAQPVISVVVCSYNSRERIGTALQSLKVQDISEPYEVIVVDSGEDGCAAYVKETYPEVRVVRSERRLYPAAARNRGVEAARGRYIAFLPDDGVAKPDWLRRRVGKHRQGFEAVGGAITNGTPFHPVGSAGYYLEYAALIPSSRTLPLQDIPHCLSYQRSVFERLGLFPEEALTGEDTVFNRRCQAAGLEVGFDPGIQLAHRNLTGLRPYLRHQYEHGKGLVRAFDRYGGELRPGAPRRASGPWQAVALTLYRRMLRYPVSRWLSGLRLIARGRPRWLPGYLVLSPLVWAGIAAAALGGLIEQARR